MGHTCMHIRTHARASSHTLGTQARAHMQQHLLRQQSPLPPPYTQPCAPAAATHLHRISGELDTMMHDLLCMYTMYGLGLTTRSAR
jgi:hypothetical protein